MMDAAKIELWMTPQSRELTTNIAGLRMLKEMVDGVLQEYEKRPKTLEKNKIVSPAFDVSGYRYFLSLYPDLQVVEVEEKQQRDVQPVIKDGALHIPGDPVAYESIELGVDGDAAFALLGPNLQEGEAEFETVIIKSDHNERQAAFTALYKLRSRLKLPEMPYHLAKSHPDYVG